jgi:flagellar brake protein
MSPDTDLLTPLPPNDLSEVYGCRHMLEIGAHLRNLAQRGDTLTLSFQDVSANTRILDVCTDSFVFDAGEPETYRALLAAMQTRFVAEPDGVRLEFVVGTPRITEFQGQPAFEADFPSVLYYMQRRAYFRVNTPATAPYSGTGVLSDGTPLSFVLADLSMSGISVRSDAPAAAGLTPGALLREVELRLGARTIQGAELEVMSVQPGEPAGGHQFGCRFARLPQSAENTLQRVITEVAVGQYRADR